MTRPTQTPGSTSDAKKRLTLVPTPCCDAAAKVARVRELADEWGAEGPSLVRHAHGARDVHEGSMLERCAADLRAALDGPAGGGGCA